MWTLLRDFHLGRDDDGIVERQRRQAVAVRLVGDALRSRLYARLPLEFRWKEPWFFREISPLENIPPRPTSPPLLSVISEGMVEGRRDFTRWFCRHQFSLWIFDKGEARVVTEKVPKKARYR